MKRTINVKIFLLALALTSGCTFFDKSLKKEIEVVSKPIERPKLQISEIPPLELENVQFVIITDKNYEEVIENQKDASGVVFLVALDEEGYKALSVNIAKILEYTRKQKSAIIAYKQYYKEGNELLGKGDEE